MTRTVGSPAVVRVRDGNQARRVSFGPAESTGPEDRLAVFRPVRPLHLDTAGLSSARAAPLPSVLSTATASVSSRSRTTREREPARRPETRAVSRTASPCSPAAAAPVLRQSIVPTTRCGQLGRCDTRPSSRPRARRNPLLPCCRRVIGYGSAGHAPAGRVEWERPQPRSARRRREDAVSCRPATGPRSSLLPRPW